MNYETRQWNSENSNGYIKERRSVMDSQLQDCVQRLNEQNDILGRVRDKYLKSESTRKHYEAKLIIGATGKSHAEKVTNAQGTEDWRKLEFDIAALESSYEFNKLKLEVLNKEYLALHLSLKIDSEVMRKS